jgi:hypothetical protein
MSGSSESADEKIIKSKKRIQNHGEVFTPKRIVNKMLDLPAVRDACQSLTATFLEPAAGEGTFLVEVLQRKLKMVAKQYGDDLARYEHHSLLALSTLYGVELLEDNALKCVMNLYQVYYEAYRQQATEQGKKMAGKVLDSAKLIISNNIAQGNFLTRRSADGHPIVFSEWQPIDLRPDSKTIKVQRTEYTIEDILNGVTKKAGEPLPHPAAVEQLVLFDDDRFDGDAEDEAAPLKAKRLRYVPVKITDVYKEEMEESDE